MFVESFWIVYVPIRFHQQLLPNQSSTDLRVKLDIPLSFLDNQVYPREWQSNFWWEDQRILSFVYILRDLSWSILLLLFLWLHDVVGDSAICTCMLILCWRGQWRFLHLIWSRTWAALDRPWEDHRQQLSWCTSPSVTRKLLSSRRGRGTAEVQARSLPMAFGRAIEER